MRRAGFTLIELLAVITVFGLLAAVALPNFGFRASRLLDEESQYLAGALEFARQRAVMTSRPHRVVVDLDTATWWLETLAPPATAEPVADAFGGFDATAAIQMSPPVGAGGSWERMQGSLGDVHVVDPRVLLSAVETADGVFERGSVALVFERDGTTEPTFVALDADGENRLLLEVAPLRDTVRISHVE